MPRTGRPKKLTLDFYMHRCDESSDLRIKKLLKLCGNDGYATYYRLKETLCNQDGLILSLADSLTQEVTADDLGLRDSAQLLKIIEVCVGVGLLNKQLWESERQVFSDDLYNDYSDRLNDRKQAAERMRRKREADALQKKIDRLEEGTRFLDVEPETAKTLATSSFSVNSSSHSSELVTHNNSLVTHNNSEQFRNPSVDLYSEICSLYSDSDDFEFLDSDSGSSSASEFEPEPEFPDSPLFKPAVKPAPETKQTKQSKRREELCTEQDWLEFYKPAPDWQNDPAAWSGFPRRLDESGSPCGGVSEKAKSAFLKIPKAQLQAMRDRLAADVAAGIANPRKQARRLKSGVWAIAYFPDCLTWLNKKSWAYAADDAFAEDNDPLAKYAALKAAASERSARIRQQLGLNAVKA